MPEKPVRRRGLVCRTEEASWRCLKSSCHGPTLTTSCPGHPRYHPVRHEFEVVAHGTVNPWGLDFNDYGEGFFPNSVTGHLWHLIPGAHYKRIYGRQYYPHTYELLDACSDHYHFAGKDWHFSRGDEGKDAHKDAGGGNAHAGAMVYLGDNWPDRYRNSVFLCNLHGNRINNDRL